jgi:hypothetical protein
VYPDPVATPDSRNEWIELYNPTLAAFEMGGCAIEDNTGGTTLPAGARIEAGGYLVIASTEGAVRRWPVSGGTLVVVGTIGNGLANAGDRLVLRCGSAIVDAVSWGSDASVLDPPPSTPGVGRSLARVDGVSAESTSARYVINRAPSPGWRGLQVREPIFLPMLGLSHPVRPAD